MAAKKTSANGAEKVTLQKVRISYPAVAEPSSINGGKEEYRCTLMIPKSDKETIKKIKDAIQVAFDNGKDELWDGKIPRSAINPLRDGDDDELFEKNEEYRGFWVINAKSQKSNKPLLLTNKKEELSEFDDANDLFYAGAWCNALIATWCYDNQSKGVGVTLKGLMFVKHDKSFGGVAKAKVSDFDVEDNDDLD